MYDQPKRVTVQDVLDYHAELDQRERARNYNPIEEWNAWIKLQAEFIGPRTSAQEDVIAREKAQERIFARAQMADWLKRSQQLPSADQLERQGLLPSLYYQPRVQQTNWLFGRQQHSRLGSIGNSLGSLGDFLGGIFK